MCRVFFAWPLQAARQKSDLGFLANGEGHFASSWADAVNRPDAFGSLNVMKKSYFI